MSRIAFSFDDMTLPEFGGDFDTALQNYFHFLRRFGVRDGRVAKQVHGAEILAANGIRNRPILPVVVGEGDAVWTSDPGVWVGVFTADCLPILIDAGDRVMAVHAGWRGLAAGIVRRAVDFLGPSSIRSVTIGPAAGGCCYEVGGEVVEGITGAGIEPVLRDSPNPDRVRIDLPSTAEGLLRALGIAPVNRSEPFGCTICDVRFQSYRRSGAAAGRNLAAIAIGDAG
jgi:polyphenol oxidase